MGAVEAEASQASLNSSGSLTSMGSGVFSLEAFHSAQEDFIVPSSAHRVLRALPATLRCVALLPNPVLLSLTNASATASAIKPMPSVLHKPPHLILEIRIAASCSSCSLDRV